jgi:hypothetical protein
MPPHGWRRIQALRGHDQGLKRASASAPRGRLARGCGHSPLGIMKIARRRTAMLRRARPRWRHSPRAGGGHEVAWFPTERNVPALPPRSTPASCAIGALFRLLPAALDHLRDLLVLFRHFREALLPQAFRPRPMPLRRLLARILAIVLGRHILPLFEGVARGPPSGAMCSGVWLTEPQPRASINYNRNRPCGEPSRSLFVRFSDDRRLVVLLLVFVLGSIIVIIVGGLAAAHRP